MTTTSLLYVPSVWPNADIGAANRNTDNNAIRSDLRYRHIPVPAKHASTTVVTRPHSAPAWGRRPVLLSGKLCGVVG